MRNAGLEEAQVGIKIAGRNINNLRYADDTTLIKLLSLGCPFCILAVCGALFIVAFRHCVWVCTGGLSRFLG